VPSSNRMQPDFGELALPSAADARRYKHLLTWYQLLVLFWNEKEAPADSGKDFCSPD
jgi:hypothetical protein